MPWTGITLEVDPPSFAATACCLAARTHVDEDEFTAGEAKMAGEKSDARFKICLD